MGVRLAGEDKVETLRQHLLTKGLIAVKVIAQQRHRMVCEARGVVR